MCDVKMSKVTMLLLYVLLYLSNPCSSEYVDELEYSKMPKLFTMDDYRDCLLHPEGLYCVIDIQLKTSNPSDLWYQIKNFSADTLKHYRHDILHKSVCVTQTCNLTDINPLEFRGNSKSLLNTLTKCMNDYLLDKYNLEGDVSIEHCEHKNMSMPINEKDWIFLIAFLFIMLANAVGTIYHLRSEKREVKIENKMLMSFSIIANWKKLMTTTDSNTTQDRRRRSLCGIQGMRFLTMMAVVFSHVVLIIPYGYVDNTLKIETPYNDPLMQLLYNGSLVVQTFFLMASFLMSYHFMLYIEKHPNASFKTFFLMLAQRWLRLTPVYALVIGFISTINERMGSGPQWNYVVGNEVRACREAWWTHLVYLNNYIRGDHVCLPQTWYMAADTQLFCYGVLVMMIIWKYPHIKRLLFSVLMVVAILIPAVLTFKYGYHPSVPQRPESFRTLYNDNPTFLKIYTTIEGNLGGYTIGLMAGCLQYYFEQNNISLKAKKWFCVFHAGAFPLGVGVILTGVLFYSDSYTYNPLFAAAYAGLYKIVFAIIVISFILGIIHQCDNVTRGCVEWSGFQILGRLTFCAYLIHTIPQRAFVGAIKQPFDVIEYNVISMFVSSITTTYFISWLVCMMIEMPFCNIQKLLFESDKEKGDKADDKTSEDTPSTSVNNDAEAPIEADNKVVDNSRL